MDPFFSPATRLNYREYAYGATLVELVTVVALLGIIAAFAVPRFFGRSDFDARGYFDLSLAAVRYAQKQSLATGCNVLVAFGSGGYSLAYGGGGCGTGAVPRPGGGNFSDSAPSGVSVGPATFCFDKMGRPRDGACAAFLGGPVSVAIGGRTLTVEPETGYTRCTAGC